MTVRLLLTSAECLYIVSLSNIDHQPSSGGVGWRLNLIRAALTTDTSFDFEVGTGALWWFERVLLSGGLQAKLPDGEQVLGTLRKVWTALLEAHADVDIDRLEWPVREEGDDARDEDEDRCTDPGTDGAAAV